MYPADADADADADAGRSRSSRSSGSAIRKFAERAIRKFAERETELVGRCSVECCRKIGLGTGLCEDHERGPQQCFIISLAHCVSLVSPPSPGCIAVNFTDLP
jgi:hypothetical protein